MSKPRLRVLIVTTDFPPSLGGIQEWALQIATELALRHDVTVVAPRQPRSDEYDARLPFKVKRFARFSSHTVMLASLAAATFIAVRRDRPDIILYAHIFAAAALYPLRRFLSVPGVVSTYGHEVQARRIQRYIGRIIMHANGCITISRYTAKLLREKGVDGEHIAVIPVGVSAHAITDPPIARNLTREYVGENDRVILTVARLDERYKGHDTVIRAMPLILARVPTAKYVIVGDGKYRDFYEKLAQSLGIMHAIVFTGRVSTAERLALYDRCDVFAMLSRVDARGGAEGFGIVFLEAAARGKPSIGGNSGGIPDAIDDNITGHLVDPTSIGAVANAISRVLLDSDEATRLGEAGRARVEAGYTWEKVARRVEAQLLDVAYASQPFK